MYDEVKDLNYHRQVVEKFFTILDRLNYRSNGFGRCLDVGGGSGLHAPWLQQRCDDVLVTDVISYDTIYKYSFRTEQRNRFVRNGIAVNYEKLQFHTVDAQSLIYRDGLFDLVVSFDAFEHIPDPAKALVEIARVTAPQGVAGLQFDPIWNSPFGHHLPHIMSEPWLHLVLSNQEFEKTIVARVGSETGARAIDIFRTEMNRRPFAYYKDIFDTIAPLYFNSIHFSRWAVDESDEPNVKHPHFEQLLLAGFDRNELMTRGIRFLGVRNDVPVPTVRV